MALRSRKRGQRFFSKEQSVTLILDRSNLGPLRPIANDRGRPISTSPSTSPSGAAADEAILFFIARKSSDFPQGE
jgi:hypothetical protein